MRKPVRTVLSCGVCTALTLALVGCAAKAGKPRPTPTYEETPMPTVPHATATPVPSAAPLSTRPIGTGVKAKKGQAIGPVITFFGAARADGGPVEPIAVDKKGIPTYRSSAGSGFILVVEAKPGLSGLDAGRRLTAYEPDDPKSRPDLEIEANRDLGNGSPAVCDRRKPNIGGVPGIKPPSFAETQHVSDAINDLSCRFETFTESSGSCTLDKGENFSFVNHETTTQHCMIVARAWSFAHGETLLSVRVRDSDGNPGPVKQMRILRPVTSAPPPALKKK